MPFTHCALPYHLRAENAYSIAFHFVLELPHLWMRIPSNAWYFHPWTYIDWAFYVYTRSIINGTGKSQAGVHELLELCSSEWKPEEAHLVVWSMKPGWWWGGADVFIQPYLDKILFPGESGPRHHFHPWKKLWKHLFPVWSSPPRISPTVCPLWTAGSCPGSNYPVHPGNSKGPVGGEGPDFPGSKTQGDLGRVSLFNLMIQNKPCSTSWCPSAIHANLPRNFCIRFNF